jgi:hypothetical protein
LQLFANSANCGGTYQRTKDGRTFIWNDLPRRGETASWAGPRDAQGYATGYGTLTWFKSEHVIVTGSNILAPARSNDILTRYTGRMVHGKFEGVVVNVDVKGRVLHGMFVNGIKTSDWIEGAPAAAYQQPSPPAPKSVGPPEPVPPAVGLPLDEHRTEKSSTANGGKPGVGETLHAVMTPSLLQAPMRAAVAPRASVPHPPAVPSPAAAVVEPVVRNRIIEDFKEETQSVFSRVSEATSNFREVERLDLAQELPTPVSESVEALMDRARDFRAKLGYETALREGRVETQTADALFVVDQITHNLAAGDAAKAATKINDFLKKDPDAPGENRKDLWRYLASMRSLCSRSEKEANVHLEQAQLFASAGKLGDALREYQEAFRLFPTPATDEKIRHLRENSLGL